MRKLILAGRSEAGKTSLTQALKGEDVHYVKTQYTKTWDITIDTPGEYAESKEHVGIALGCFAFDSDVIGDFLCEFRVGISCQDAQIGSIKSHCLLFLHILEIC